MLCIIELPRFKIPTSSNVHNTSSNFNVLHLLPTVRSCLGCVRPLFALYLCVLFSDLSHSFPFVVLLLHTCPRCLSLTSIICLFFSPHGTACLLLNIHSPFAPLSPLNHPLSVLSLHPDMSLCIGKLKFAQDVYEFTSPPQAEPVMRIRELFDSAAPLAGNHVAEGVAFWR